MSEQNYGELFCEAVDTIVKLRLQGVAFDLTVLCTIIDDSKREQGIYKVSNGSSQFEAYSSITDYRNNSNVYVQIPLGDWNSLKFIVGKKNKNDVEEAFVYKNPFSSLVDITGNLVKADTSSYAQSALIANHPDKQEIVIWSYNLKKSSALYQNSGIKLSSYTRLGILAQFLSWLNPYPVSETKSDEYGPIEYTTRMENVIEGNYGLKLRVLALLDNITGEDLEFTPYEFLLNTNDMNGNPYNFLTFFQLEKLFDISDLREISSMELVFYQDAGTFMNDKKEKRPYLNDFFGEPQEIEPNLFVKDIYISLGYGTEEFDEEMVNIYTLQSSNYARTAELFEDNHRRVELRWIHKQRDGSFKSITELNNDLEFEVRWYRYSLGAPSADEYSDVYWTALSRLYIDTDTKKFEYDIQDEDWKKYNELLEKAENRREPGFFYSWILPDVALQTELIKAVIIYNNKPYRSNVLVLRNEDEVVSRPTVDAILALTINCEDGTYGNYRIYAEGNLLINPADSSVRREFKLYFKSEYENTLPDEETGSYELVEARALEWVIPSTNTMIRLPKDWEDLAKKGGPADGGLEELADDSNSGKTNIFFWTDELGNYHIKRFGWKDPNDDSAVYLIYNQLPYYISSYYSELYSNNTISCTIEKEPNTFYTATKPLTFGIAGTTGTDVTLVIDFQNVSIHAIDIEDSEKYAQIFVANLYDSENKNVTEDAISKGCTFTWGWLGDSSKGTILSNDGRNLLYKISDSLGVNRCEVYFANTPTEIDRTSWNILACTVTGWGDYDLVAFLPIPLKRKIDNFSPAYIQGTQRIIYNSEGHPSYYKGPYELYCSENYGEPNIANISWEMSYDEKDENKKYYPQIFTEIKDADGNTINDTPYLKYSLKALNFYVKDSSDGINVLCKYGNTIVWSLPLLIMQNRYPSAMLNKWDGSLTIDENNNSILAAKIAAGRKNDDHTFSGVLMGDVAGDINSEDAVPPIYNEDGSLKYKPTLSTTGLYGFNRGAMSFGFRDNGTAFIGKSDHGRILFDGNKGLIHSASWDAEKDKNLADGMYIDLDDAILIMQKDFSEDNTIASGVYVRKYPTREEFDSNKIQYYYHRAYDIVKHDGNLDKTIKYYSPFAYEEVKVYVDEYETLMADGKPKFYSYYYTLDIPDTTVEEGKNPTTGDIEVDGSVNTGGFDDENNDVIILNITPKYALLTVSKIPKELLDVKGNNYAPVEQTDSEGKKYYSLYIPSDFSENNNLSEGKWYYYLNEISKNDDGVEILSLVAATAIFDPTLNYYIVESYKENIGTSTENTKTYNRRYITLSADERVYPLAIGATHLISSRKFRVKWDGTVYIQDGLFSGTINATDGTLGNLRVLGTLSGGIISGAQISGSKITGSRVEANYLYCLNGNIGGWTIGYNYLRGGGITLNSLSGLIIGGTIKGSTLYSNTGLIGGWYITKSTFLNKDNKEDKNQTTATIRLNSKDGSIQGGILRTKYKLDQVTGDINKNTGGMILDGFLRIANPVSNRDNGELEIVPGSYFGYMLANTDNAILNDLSDGLGMLISKKIETETSNTTYIYRSLVSNLSAGITIIDENKNTKTNSIYVADDSIGFKATLNDSSNFTCWATGICDIGSKGEFSYRYYPEWKDGEIVEGKCDDRLNITPNQIWIGLSFEHVKQGVGVEPPSIIIGETAKLDKIELQTAGSTISLNRTEITETTEITKSYLNTIGLLAGPSGPYISMCDGGKTAGIFFTAEGATLDILPSGIKCHKDIAVKETATLSGSALSFSEPKKSDDTLTTVNEENGSDNTGSKAEYGLTGMSVTTAGLTTSVGAGSITVTHPKKADSTSEGSTTINGPHITTSAITASTITISKKITLEAGGTCEGLYVVLA